MVLNQNLLGPAHNVASRLWLIQCVPQSGACSEAAKKGGDTIMRETGIKMTWTRMSIIAMGLMLASLSFNVMQAQSVTTNSMPGTNFSQFHTYKWVAVEGATQPNQIMDTQIKSAIDSQLATKGLTKTDGDTADLYIDYQVSVDQQKQWSAYGMGGGPRWGMGGGMATATSSNIDIGTLVLDMYDPSTKQLVWTGRATKTLDTGANQAKQQKNLNKAMQKLLKNFPPQQK